MKYLFLIILILGISFQISFSTQTQSKIASNSSSPQIALNRSQLNFGVVGSNCYTNYQKVGVFDLNSSGGSLNWSVSSDKDWLICKPDYGTCPSNVKVYLGNCSRMGETTAILTFTNSDDTSQTIDLPVTVNEHTEDSPPFGSFDTPIHNTTVRSSIPVTGWVLDDVGVEDVKIYNENNGSLTYIGDATFIEGARPDIEESYSSYPQSYQAGWGYMLLTNFLPNNGNGTYTLHAIATDTYGKEVSLGSKTITCDNANAVKPFGAIDTPTQGGTASGNSYINWGWVLTPQPNSIPTDGSTINVWIDGVNQGNPVYNIYRADIASFFPGYSNSNGAAGYFYLDTTAYADGVHTIQWTATDSGNNTDGIGSRYFTIDNSN